MFKDYICTTKTSNNKSELFIAKGDRIKVLDYRNNLFQITFCNQSLNPKSLPMFLEKEELSSFFKPIN